MTIEKAKQNIRQALADYDKVTYQHTVLADVSDSFIDRLARDSVQAKQGLRDLFSKSPVWDAELDALVINGTRTHNPDPNRIFELGEIIIGGAWSPTCMQALRLFWDQDLDEHDREEAIKDINTLAPGAYVPGRKLSRVFKALCVALGVADETAGSTFQRLYAQFADELTARKLDFKLYVSINAAHFLTMSNPKDDKRGNTLTSCHSFNSTDYPYNCGCSGYARDNTSFIVFTVDDPHNPESFNNRKTTRQVFAYRPGSGLLLQSRMYNTSGGVYGAAEDSKLYRDLIQREISALENVPNLWRTFSSYGEKRVYVEEGAGFGGYADWVHDNFDGHLCFRADCDMDTVAPLVVGTYGLCVKCGCVTSDGMYCDCCRDEEFCEDCESCCAETFLVYDPRGRERYVCEDCRDENYIYCDRCQNFHHQEAMTWVSDADEYYCEDCLSEVAEHCEGCGEWHLRENMTPAYDRYGYEAWVCDDCLEPRYVQCDDCGEWHHRDRISTITLEDGTVANLCEACCEKREEKAV